MTHKVSAVGSRFPPEIIDAFQRAASAAVFVSGITDEREGAPYVTEEDALVVREMAELLGRVGTMIAGQRMALVVRSKREKVAMTLEFDWWTLPGQLEGARGQIDRLANFIMTEVPGEPSQSEGAGDTAIRVIRRLLGQPEPR